MQLLSCAHLYPCTNSTLFEQYMRNIKTSYVQIFFVFQYDGKNQKRKWSPSKKVGVTEHPTKIFIHQVFFIFLFFFSIISKMLYITRAQPGFFKGGGHTGSYIRYSPDCHLNIVGCLLTKRLTKGGSRAPQDPPWLCPCITKQSIPQKKQN